MGSNSLPIEESLDNTYPYPLQESEDQRRQAFSQQLRQRRERVFEDSPNWLDLAHLFIAKIRNTIGNISIATFVAYLVAVAMQILKIFSVEKSKTREREEMKTKVEEIKNTKLKEIEHYKGKLDEQIKEARQSLFRISHLESMAWEMNLIRMQELVFECRAEIACLQQLVDRVESEACTTINWIYVQLTTGLVVIGVLCYLVYIREDGQTGTTVSVIMTGCLLGVVTHCIRKAQVSIDSYAVASECDEVKQELEKPMMACLMYKHAVEGALPEMKKILRVVDHEILKCKND